MDKVVEFQGRRYHLVMTDHAKQRMAQRNISPEQAESIIKSGTVKAKEVSNRFWVFEEVKGRRDNCICLSVKIEKPNLIVITALINWKPI